MQVGHGLGSERTPVTSPAGRLHSRGQRRTRPGGSAATLTHAGGPGAYHGETRRRRTPVTCCAGAEVSSSCVCGCPDPACGCTPCHRRCSDPGSARQGLGSRFTWAWVRPPDTYAPRHHGGPRTRDWLSLLGGHPGHPWAESLNRRQVPRAGRLVGRRKGALTCSPGTERRGPGTHAGGVGGPW